LRLFQTLRVSQTLRVFSKEGAEPVGCQDEVQRTVKVHRTAGRASESLSEGGGGGKEAGKEEGADRAGRAVPREGLGGGAV
jgi:hypothetical protein